MSISEIIRLSQYCGDLIASKTIFYLSWWGDEEVQKYNRIIQFFSEVTAAMPFLEGSPRAKDLKAKVVADSWELRALLPEDPSVLGLFLVKLEPLLAKCRLFCRHDPDAEAIQAERQRALYATWVLHTSQNQQPSLWSADWWSRPWGSNQATGLAPINWNLPQQSSWRTEQPAPVPSLAAWTALPINPPTATPAAAPEPNNAERIKKLKKERDELQETLSELGKTVENSSTTDDDRSLFQKHMEEMRTQLREVYQELRTLGSVPQ